MNAPVPSGTYHALIGQLAELTAGLQVQRAEARTWYDRQCAAADRAVRDATEQLRAAEAELTAATEEAERVDAEVSHLWQALRGRAGVGVRRLGDPPSPAPTTQNDPVSLLSAVRELLNRTGQPGELPGSANPVLALLGALGAAAAYALGLAARAAGERYGGDLAVGMPVLALVVSLLGPLVGLAPAKLLADRRHAVLGPRPMAVVLIAGLVTTGLLLAVAR